MTSLFWYAFWLLSASASKGLLSPSEIDELRFDLLKTIDESSNSVSAPNDKPLAAHIVRLVFHDCSGPQNAGDTQETVNNEKRICDGCIDVDLADHRGLYGMAIEPLESIYDKYQRVYSLSRSDFWIAAGNVALEYTASLSPKPGSLPSMPYFFGRRDCKFSPDAVTDANTHFVQAVKGWDAAFDFFRAYWKMTLRQITALFGAHTLGKMHASNSGFHGQWTSHPSHFDNEYFVQLFNVQNQWDQVFNVTANGLPQWSNEGRQGGDPRLTMLNSDYSLLARIDEPAADPHLDVETGIVSCRAKGFELYETGQCLHEISFNRVEDFVVDNQMFYDEFVSAWTVLVNNHQHNLTRVIPNRFVDPRTDAPTTPPTTNAPSTSPVVSPTTVPTLEPTLEPTDLPTETPSNVPINAPTSAPTIIVLPQILKPLLDQEGPNFCCVAKTVPNWNGRCWGHLSETDCHNEPKERCRWDPNNCQIEINCLLRHANCTSDLQCCSERCRGDNTCR